VALPERHSRARRALSGRGFTAISHFYVMDWASVWSDIVLGLLISGTLTIWVPQGFWTALFLSGDPVWSKIVAPLIGPAVAVLSFVCSVGNVPLAAVLWNAASASVASWHSCSPT
jgi:uncharacterized protein